jgi:hypothetical protein
VEIARTTGSVVKVVKMFTYCQPTEDLCRPTERPKAPASPGA